MNPPYHLGPSSMNANVTTLDTSSNSSDSFPSLPNLNLQETIAVIEESINLAEKSLKSACEFLHLTERPNARTGCAICPFDPRHRMPSESLFRHSLICSSSPGIVELSILDCLRYPNSLKAAPENKFVKPLQDLDVELCFSLDEFGAFGSNFYYRDCPGVVSSTYQEKTFLLPGILAVECVNFMYKSNQRSKCLPILPSELCVMTNEVNSWKDFPLSYSHIVLRVLSCLAMAEKTDIRSWILLNSPYYGIIIDGPMRDHIFTLLKLCLMAISSAASLSLETIIETDNLFNLDHLIQILRWLASQISLLYGEANGKLFVINMFKQCLLDAGSHSLLFPSSKNQNESADAISVSYGLRSEPPVVNVGQSGNCEDLVKIPSTEGENITRSVKCDFEHVSVSQVAAAIAALHERALLEEKIKDLRIGRQLPKMQLLAEYSRISTVANEERRNRPDYRPLLEHDGLMWQRFQNQDSRKNKTREELLAEERDYKRRRMSYRGKKGKRTTTQVIRDIIDEHMEEIKEAGGIGCFMKGAAGAENSLLSPISSGDVYQDMDKSKCSSYESSEAIGKNSYPSYVNSMSFADKNNILKRPKSRTSIGKDRRDRSRSPHSYERHRYAEEKRLPKRNLGDFESKDRYEREESVSSYRSKHSRNDVDRDRLGYSQTSGERHSGRTHREKSGYQRYNAFEDGYDPAGRCDMPKDTCVSSNSGKHEKESQRSEYSAEGADDFSYSYDGYMDNDGGVSVDGKCVSPEGKTRGVKYDSKNCKRNHNKA